MSELRNAGLRQLRRAARLLQKKAVMIKSLVSSGARLSQQCPAPNNGIGVVHSLLQNRGKESGFLFASPIEISVMQVLDLSLSRPTHGDSRDNKDAI